MLDLVEHDEVYKSKENKERFYFTTIFFGANPWTCTR